MPASAVFAVCCEMPLETASLLKAASQASKFPVSQDAAAKAGAARKESAAPSARENVMLTRGRDLIAVTNAGSDSRCPDRAVQNVGVNRGQNKAGTFLHPECFSAGRRGGLGRFFWCLSCRLCVIR